MNHVTESVIKNVEFLYASLLNCFELLTYWEKEKLNTLG